MSGAWVPLTVNGNQWIQADLGSLMQVNGVVTQGRADYNQWVTSYKVYYSTDGSSFELIAKDGNQIFDGNSDRTSQVTRLFDQPLQARYIRIQPTAFYDRPSMRFDVLGCSIVT
ncbi:unnamed protein product [Owenia fusiformis]|nr:unnamed protein product [Owenia fusiformis]